MCIASFHHASGMLITMWCACSPIEAAQSGTMRPHGRQSLSKIHHTQFSQSHIYAGFSHRQAHITHSMTLYGGYICSNEAVQIKGWGQLLTTCTMHKPSTLVNFWPAGSSWGKHLVAMYTSCGYHLVISLLCTTNQLWYSIWTVQWLNPLPIIAVG